MKNLFLKSLLDHYQSMSLLFGMWGNIFLSKYYENLAFGVKKILDNIEKE
ncbi:MAG TPA: hypothetical protein PKW55_07240 [Spirochaetota bacterium]|nr:hypothetical protein [Spirochaetota bacterium]HOM38625.1 hypothetical protein [Spirochaetota bacterium]HPQ49762.1 hypothetical protein [Spirochaetota bacterium]